MKTLSNSYHSTLIRIRTALSWEEIEQMAYYAKGEPVRYRTRQDRNILALHRRIKSRLCGMSDCKCGTVR